MFLGAIASTGINTFFGPAASLVGQDDNTLAACKGFSLRSVLSTCSPFHWFVPLEIVILYPHIHYPYSHGLDNILESWPSCSAVSPSVLPWHSVSPIAYVPNNDPKRKCDDVPLPKHL
ncbi:plasma membrane H+-ATPase [Ceratobasidium sp. 394]|nr:plasma membrane H+-ATPase [Ceratobasidium sp. 394]KAG9098958.1 plasma membrane H+-ATPase [Ceratobasidium sp. UAMH 11750]